MEMADNPKLELDSTFKGRLMEENTGTDQKISVSDHVNGFQYTSEKSDSFVIDMESFSANKDTNPNSRITLQRSHSRKGSQRIGDKKINSNFCVTDRESTTALVAAPRGREAVVSTSSPRGTGTPEKPVAVALGTTDHCSSSQQVHHQITITTGNINATSTGGRGIIRRNSFKRSTPSWVLDPKRVLFFFATLSSVGTMLLIYLTLSIGKLNVDENALD